MNSQQPQYEQFIQSGLSILDKCDPECFEAEGINRQLDAVNKSWDKLTDKLAEREAILKETLDLSNKYYDVLQDMSAWLPEITEKVEHLAPVSSQPEVIEGQKQELQVCYKK